MSRPGHPEKEKEKSPFTAWRERLADRLARSSRVFLIGLLLACGVEVVVDWNATLKEINILRGGMRQRGLNYVSILAKAAVEPTLSYDADAMDNLSSGLFSDEDVAYVRFTDQRGTLLYDRLRPSFRDLLKQRKEPPFRERYATQMERDIDGILTDPERLKTHIRMSRHRDFAQAWNDTVAALASRLSRNAAQPDDRAGPVVYQDRLRKTDHTHDAEVTYALGDIEDERNETWGVVLVAFSMERTNAAIQHKLVKGAGMLVFFIGLILVQNVLSRRDKLRLLDLEVQKRGARAAILAALPGQSETGAQGGVTIAAVLKQAEGGVDGLLWDVQRTADEGRVEVLVIDPDGEGVAAAATALHVLATFRQRCTQGAQATPEEEVRRLGQVAASLPLSRPVGLLLLRIDGKSGEIQGVSGPIGGLRLISEGSRVPLAETPIQAGPEPIPGVMEPLFRLAGTLPSPGLLLLIFAGTGRSEDARRRVDADAVAGYVGRERRKEKGSLQELAADTAIWARGRVAGGSTRDVLALILARGEGA